MRAGLFILVAAATIASPIRADEFIDLYKAARTVADVEAANGKVREEVLRVQSIAADVARLHVANMTACENVGASDLDATAAKAQAFSITLARIDTELLKSLTAMRQQIAASTRARDDVNRFTVARTNSAGSTCRVKRSRKRSRASRGTFAAWRRRACPHPSRRCSQMTARPGAG